MSDPTAANLLYTGKVMTLGLITGPTLFLGVVMLIIFSNGSSSTSPAVDLQLFLSICLGLWAGLLLITSPVIALLRKSSSTPQQYLTAHILRMALAEAPALAAIVGLLIFAPAMKMKETPELALLLIPYLSLLITGFRHLPDMHKLNEFISGGVR
jgi:hypothetical protein